MHAYIHTCKHARAHTYIHTQAHTHIHTHTHTYIHTLTADSEFSPQAGDPEMVINWAYGINAFYITKGGV